MKSRPRSLAISIAVSRAASKSWPVSISSAPSARIAAFFSGELPMGQTMVELMPTREAAKGMDWPWLPRVAVMTPPVSPLSLRIFMCTRPPRTLKAPVGVWFSCFTQVSQPVSCLSSGQAYCGVGGMAA